MFLKLIVTNKTLFFQFYYCFSKNDIVVANLMGYKALPMCVCVCVCVCVTMQMIRTGDDCQCFVHVNVTFLFVLWRPSLFWYLQGV